MNAAEQMNQAKEFARTWGKDVKEDGNTAPFWLSLLSKVFGIEQAESYIHFEDGVKHEEKGNTIFVDAHIPSVRVMIEQKASSVALDKPYERHGNKYQSVYEQAFEYDQTLPVSQRSKYIIACNFHEFWIYDMDVPESIRKPIKLTLDEFPQHFHQLDFLVDENAKPSEVEEVKVSIKAGALVGKLYDALLAQYKNPDKEGSQRSLNVLCVRIVFLLYAEDSGLLGGVDQFYKYLTGWKWQNARDALMQLFKVLDTKLEERDPYLREDLACFPYVNGGLFHDENIEIPRITEEIFEIITKDMSQGFDWSVISPTIFGAAFESTLNPQTRRSGGMHYTSIANIHKVIDPLFMETLKAEYKSIVSVPDTEKYMANRREMTLKYDYRARLEGFQKKLSSLVFLDPACGSGNFLTETYLCLRRLENKVIEELSGGQQILGDLINPIQVSISQFYGIEINDFAVTVAKTALWIAESQMMKETEDIIHKSLDFLPLKTNAYIHEGNALQMNWKEIVSKEKLSYIMGNPPFVGFSMRNKEQKKDMLSIFVDEKGKNYKATGKIDYVGAWYFKAAELMQNTAIKAAFVSTNSICQGEQVAALWKPLYDRFHVNINFAWRSFEWDSESNKKATVYCVIVGFSDNKENGPKVIYDNADKKMANKINPYLENGETIFIEARQAPLCEIPTMRRGNQPTDDGNLILTIEEKKELLQKEPQAATFLRPFMMGKDFIDRKPRYCLWLVNAKPSMLRNCPHVMKRIKAVQEYRLASKKAATRGKAKTPMLFDEHKENKTSYIAIPKVSSANRRYIPMEWLPADIIPGDKLFIVEGATLYHFAVLTSNVHMAWMRRVSGRLKMDYSYSKNIIYNNFPWPTPTESQKARIEQTAKNILNARDNHPDASLADLYNPLLMPADLRKAHQENDKAVMEAYGFNWHTMKEEDCVAALMKMYQTLIEKEKAKQKGEKA